MVLEVDNDFWYDVNDLTSQVFEIYPKIFGDHRGGFSQSISYLDYESTKYWVHKLDWIKQVNRSYSEPYVFRGIHAQRGVNCQAKLVECLFGIVFDVILDARPQSKTFGKIKVYTLSGKKQNKLFCPRGFLHGFLSGAYNEDNESITTNYFQYFCDSVFDKQAELGVNPKSIMSLICNNIKKEDVDLFNKTFNNMDKIILSEKDTNAIGIDDFLNNIQSEYKSTNGKLWYK